MPGQINGFSLAYTAVGAVVLWSGIKGETISDTFRGLLSGQAPSSDTEAISTAASPAAPVSATGAAAAASSAEYDSSSALQKLWTSNGGASDTAAFAAAIAMAESGGNAEITSSNPDGGTNVGIFQLDTRGVGSGYSVAQLQNANLNTQITVRATDDGTNWTEWGDPVSAAVGGHYTPGSPVPGVNNEIGD